MITTVESQSPYIPAKRLLARAREAVVSRDWDEAYRLSKQMTRLDPEDPEGWLLRFRTSRKEEDQLFCLSKACQLSPDHPRVAVWMNKTLWRELERDPFLAYMDETDQMYIVKNKKYLSLALPKGRGVPETYPPLQPSSLAPANRWLIRAAVVLPLAGIGTLLFAPLAIWHAVLILGKPAPRSDQVRAVLVVLIAMGLSVLAFLLVWLLVMHL